MMNKRPRLIVIAGPNGSGKSTLTSQLMKSGNELAEYLKTKGFEILVPGRLSYRQQIQAFSEASVVIGPHGAGLTNIVFCPKGAKVVELFSERFFYPEKFAYKTHCAIRGMFYDCIVSDIIDHGSGWSISMGDFKRFYDGLFDRFRSVCQS